MRRDNSSFKTAFLSEAGSRLKNNDYFGFVELDGYACYVVADGITHMHGSESARTAIEAVINAFQEEPGISRRKLRGYLRRANRELLHAKGRERLKASVTVVVTDYQKCRYGYAGNTRFRLYRNGKKIRASFDMSKGQDLVKEEKISQDRLAQHEERNNLYSFFGDRSYHPYISGKIRLQEGDIITLYTRGIWENVDEGELEDVFAEAGDEPAEECDKVEDLLLSRQPEDLEDYTFAAIYVDKVFQDPKRKKRIRKAVLITVVVTAVILGICLAVFFWRRARARKRTDMEQHFSDMGDYIEDDNFIRAKEECDKALELAGELGDEEAKGDYRSFLRLLEAVINADDAYDAGDHSGAREAYLSARARSRYADNAGMGHIEKRLSQIGDYEQVFDSIAMGDRLSELGSYELAEEKYLEAKAKAAAIYFTEGRQQALDALDALYEAWDASLEETQEEQDALAAAQASAAELVKQGDAASAEKDYDGALVYYLIAQEKYGELDDTAQIALLNRKISTLNEKKAEVEARMEEARALEEQARKFEEEKDYEQAKAQYQYAKAVYTEIGQDNKANEVQGKIDILETKTAKQEKEQAAAEKEEQAEKEAQEKKEKEEKEAQEKKEKEEQEAKEKEARERAELERLVREEVERQKKEEEKGNGSVSGNSINGG